MIYKTISHFSRLYSMMCKKKKLKSLSYQHSQSHVIVYKFSNIYFVPSQIWPKNFPIGNSLEKGFFLSMANGLVWQSNDMGRVCIKYSFRLFGNILLLFKYRNYMINYARSRKVLCGCEIINDLTKLRA